MACVNCHKIRSAILHGKMAEAAGLSVAALREKIGLTAKGDAIAEAPANDAAAEAPEKQATKGK